MSALLALALAASPGPGGGAARPIPPEIKAAIEQREAAASEDREEAIRLLEEIVKRDPGGPHAPEAMFKLAGLYWERARAAFLASQGKVEKLELGPAIALYEQLAALSPPPSAPPPDDVLYLYGFALAEAGRADDSQRALRRLIDGYPRSKHVADAWLAIAEQAFDAGRYADAIPAYRAVVSRTKDPAAKPLVPFALYKLGWAEYRVKSLDPAAAAFRDVLDSPDASAQLADEAAAGLARILADVGGSPAAYLARLGAERHAAKVLPILGDVFEKQAEFKKAINTYRQLLQRNPDAPDVPARLLAIAHAWEKLGDPGRALDARIELAEKVGPGSAWARKQPPAAAKDAADVAERELREAAEQFHQRAQKDKRDEEYARAAEGYAAYDRRFPQAPAAPEVRYYRGEALWHLQQYADAAKAYEAAFTTGRKEAWAREAAYSWAASLDKVAANEKWKGKGLSPGETELMRAADAFLAAFPDDARAAELALRAARIDHARGRFDEAADRLQALLEKRPPADVAVAAADLLLDARRRAGDYAALEATARGLKSNAAVASQFGGKLDAVAAGARYESAKRLENGGKLREAALAYEQLARDYRDVGMKAAGRDKNAAALVASLEAALFDAGALREKLGEREAALADFDRCAREHGRSELGARAAFRSAKLLEASLQFEDAAEQYELAARGDPKAAREERDGAEQTNALFNAGVLWEALGKKDNAFRDFAAYAGRKPVPRDAGEAFLRGARGLAPRDAARELDGFAKRFKDASPAVRISAALERGLALAQLGRARDAEDAFREAVSAQKRDAAKDPDALEAAARARFELAEQELARYDALKFDVPRSRLAARLKEKAERLQAVEKEYGEVAAYGRADWAAAALLRIGFAYERFAQALFDAPLPRGLGGDDAEAYRAELRNQAYPVEEQAIKFYEAGLQKARATRSFSKWTRQMRERLAKLDPAGHPQLAEERPAPAFAVDLPAHGVIEEVAR